MPYRHLGKDSRIYIAGHESFVGKALVKILQENGYSNLLLSGLEEENLSNYQEVDEFFASRHPEYVFYCAGRTGGIGLNSRAPASLMYDNLVKQTGVINAAFAYGVEKLIYFGSSCSYPQDCPRPIKEEYLLTGGLEPSNEAYAVARIAGVKMCQAFNQQYGTRFISIMPANIYGPGDDFDSENSHVLAGMIQKFVTARRENEPQVVLWGSGIARRDFIYVEDLARAGLFLMQKYEGSLPLNAGPGREISTCELALVVSEEAGYEGEIIFDSSRPDGTISKLMDCSRINALGWAPRVGLRDGIRLTCRWFEQNSGKEDDVRLVVMGYRQYNIVHCQGRYYGWPWPAGEFSLAKFRSGDFPMAVVGGSVIEAQNLIDKKHQTIIDECQSVASNRSLKIVSTDERFLLIKAAGAGFWSDMTDVWGKLLLAEITNRRPVVFWGKSSHYSVDETLNSFEQYFLPVSDYSTGDLVSEKYSYYPPTWKFSNIFEEDRNKWSGAYRDMAGFVNCDADVLVSDTHHCMLYDVIPRLGKNHPAYGKAGEAVFRYIVEKYTRLQPCIIDEIEEFYQAHNMGETPILAVHIRSGKRLRDVPQLGRVNAEYPEEINRLLEKHPQARIFLLTDDETVLRQYREMYGDILINTECNRKNIDGHDPFEQVFPDRIRKGIEVIKDAYLACKCDYFIGTSHSNVSLAISRLKNWEKDRIKLLWKPELSSG